MLDGFSPKLSEVDRRLLYEVTGLRLYADEFRDEESSDDDGDPSKSLGYHAQTQLSPQF